MKSTPFEVSGDRIGGARKVWVEQPVSGEASDCVIFLDGELYLDRVKAPDILRDLQESAKVAPITSVYVSFRDTAARHADFTCNEAFSAFVAEDLPRWIEGTMGPCQRLFLCGLSLSGLAAVFAALRFPGGFSGIISQSPSAWWNDEWLAASLREESQRGRFWISVGTAELQENVSHPPTGLLQKTSQLESVRRLSAKLREVGHEVTHHEFAGGHDPLCWAEELPAAMAWMLQGA